MKKCIKCENKELVGVEYFYGHNERYDGISEWLCLECNTRVGRWSGIILKEDEVESRFGARGAVKREEDKA